MLRFLIFCLFVSLAQAQFGFFRRIGSAFGSVEMADYTVVADHGDGIEERLYPSKKWVCNTYRAARAPTREMFMKLFKYIDGENTGEVKVPMTAPVSTLISPLSTGDLRSFEMCFYIPEAFQASAPSPTNLDVHVVTRPEMTVLTRKVGGYIMSDTAWEEEANSLKAVLQSKKLPFQDNRYYRNGYDAPFKFWNRRNEVWYVKA